MLINNLLLPSATIALALFDSNDFSIVEYGTLVEMFNENITEVIKERNRYIFCFLKQYTNTMPKDTLF